jgi:hypothetical protein
LGLLASIGLLEPTIGQLFQIAFSLKCLNEFICNWIQNLLVNPLLLDSVLRTADRRPDLKMLLINIVFGQADLNHLTPRRVVRSVLKLSAAGKRG